MSERTRNVGIRVTEATRKRWHKAAIDRGTSLQGLIEEAVRALLKRRPA